MPTHAPGALRVEVARDLSELARLENGWRELFARSPAAAPPLRWEWVREWCRLFGPAYMAPQGLRVLAVRRGSTLIGVLPLYEQAPGRDGGRSAVRFISCGMHEFEETCAQYADLLYAPGEGPACAGAVVRALGDRTLIPWDDLELHDLSSTSPLVGLAERLRASGAWTALAGASVSHIADADDGFEAYLGRLSPKARGKARKLIRQAERAGVTLEVARDADEAGAFFDQLVDLHRRRWNAVGLPGSFAPRHAAFHRALAVALVPAGHVVLARLLHEGRPLAAVIGHLVRDKLDVYQQGVLRVQDPVRSPGVLVNLLLMRHLCARGVRRFDHLKGENDFKDQYFETRHPLITLRAVRPTVRVALHAANGLAARVGRRAVRALRSTAAALG